MNSFFGTVTTRRQLSSIERGFPDSSSTIRGSFRDRTQGTVPSVLQLSKMIRLNSFRRWSKMLLTHSFRYSPPLRTGNIMLNLLILFPIQRRLDIFYRQYPHFYTT